MHFFRQVFSGALRRDTVELFLIFLRLGLTSFGGPVAHLAYFREMFVDKRGWLSPGRYAELVALCQFLPGPASSQVGMAIGLQRAGYWGALAAWLGFTLPSALLMISSARLLVSYAQWVPVSFLHGLKVVTVAVVAQAVWSMGRALCHTRLHLMLMLLATLTALAIPTVAGQLAAMAVAAIIGRFCLCPDHGAEAVYGSNPLNWRTISGAAVLPLLLYLTLLVVLPLLVKMIDSNELMVVNAFYRAGALVFGGGHVVLPLLQAELVVPGWIDADTFLAGYSLAQAMPGPLFTFAGFVGAASGNAASGWLSILAIFTPSFLLVAGTLPIWEQLRSEPRVRGMLAGINAAVVGLLLATLIDPVCRSALMGWADLILAGIAFIALQQFRLPAWVVVIGGALVSCLWALLVAAL